MARSLSQQIIDAKALLHDPVPLVRLYHLRRDATPANDRFFAEFHTDILYDPQDGGGARTWTATSAGMTPRREKDGLTAEWQIAIQNVDLVLANDLEAGKLLNQRLDVFQVTADQVAVAGHHRRVGAYEVLGVVITEETAVFRLGHFRFWDHPYPGERASRDRCPHDYEGGTRPTVDGRCAAVDAAETCDKSFEGAGGCAGRSNQDRYGALKDMLVGPNPLLP